MKTSASQSGRARWSQLISEQKRSGLSIAEFCRVRGVAQPTFYVWRKRLGVVAEPASGFVEIKLTASETQLRDVASPVAPVPASLELVLPGGVRLLLRRGFDRDLVRDLVSALEGLS